MTGSYDDVTACFFRRWRLVSIVADLRDGRALSSDDRRFLSDGLQRHVTNWPGPPRPDPWQLALPGGRRPLSPLGYWCWACWYAMHCDPEFTRVATTDGRRAERIASSLHLPIGARGIEVRAAKFQTGAAAYLRDHTDPDHEHFMDKFMWWYSGWYCRALKRGFSRTTANRMRGRMRDPLTQAAVGHVR